MKPAGTVCYIAIPCSEASRSAWSTEWTNRQSKTVWIPCLRSLIEPLWKIIRLNYDRDTGRRQP